MLQFITHNNEKYDYVKSAEVALLGGCKWIQLRMKDALHDEFVAAAKIVKEMCIQHDAIFIIDDYVQWVDEVKADGVHLGKNDMSPIEARQLLGEQPIIGGTANTFADIERLIAQQIDYIGVGPFRYTETKKNLSPTLGLEGYRELVTQCRNKNYTTPMVAIGGITKEDIPAIMDCGMNGIALSGYILNAPDPIKETAEIIEILKPYYI